MKRATAVEWKKRRKIKHDKNPGDLDNLEPLMGEEWEEEETEPSQAEGGIWGISKGACCSWRQKQVS